MLKKGRSNGSKICWDMLNVGTEEAAKNIVGKQELEKHCQIWVRIKTRGYMVFYRLSSWNNSSTGNIA